MGHENAEGMAHVGVRLTAQLGTGGDVNQALSQELRIGLQKICRGLDEHVSISLGFVLRLRLIHARIYEYIYGLGEKLFCFSLI